MIKKLGSKVKEAWQIFRLFVHVVGPGPAILLMIIAGIVVGKLVGLVIVRKLYH